MINSRKTIWSFIILWIASSLLFAQNSPVEYELKGNVTSVGGAAIESAEIYLSNRLKTINSDENGDFSTLVNENELIVVEAEGYKTQTVLLKGEKELNIILKPFVIGEVLQNAAMGKYLGRGLSASFSTIDADVIRRNNVMRVEEAMNGTLSGLYSLKSGGETFGSTNYALYVRGKSTTGDATPLILVDGVDANINLIDASEIESVTVLKDASELAMYGMRGANGVILINTKEGNRKDKFIHLDVRAGVQTPVKIASKLNAYQYTTLYNEAATNDGAIAIYDPDVYLSDHDAYSYPDTDMPGDFLKNHSSYQQYNFTLGGGNRNTQYFALLGYSKQDGLFEQSDEAKDDYASHNYSNERYNFRTNLNIDLGRGFTFESKLQAIFDKVYAPYVSGKWCNTIANYLFKNIMTTPANAYPIFNKDGSLGGTSEYTNNPVGDLDNGSRVEESRQLTALVRLGKDLDFITPGLSAHIMYDFSNFNSYYKNRYHSFAVYQQTSDTSYTKYNDDETQISRSGGTLDNYFVDHTIEGRLDYDRSFGLHDFTGALVFNTYSSKVSGDYPTYMWLGTSVRMLYGYDKKYYVQLAGSYQGSNSYASGKRYGFFPSIGLSWIASDEDFMSNVSFIDYLKIKTSFGLIGNDQTGGSRFMYRQYYYLGDNYGFGNPNGDKQGAYEGSLANENETWETAYMGNIGAELLTLNQTLSFEANYFYERRTDILVSESNLVPSVIGVSLPSTNAGVIKNQGVEMTVTYNNSVGDLEYGIGGNLMYARNEIIDLKETAYKYDWQYKKGHSINTVFGLKANGLLFADEVASAPTSSYGVVQAGDIKYINQNSDDDNLINDFDKVALGSTFPELIYGFNIYAKYKGFDFYCYGEGAALYSKYIRPDMYSEYAYNNRYQGDAGASYPRLSLSSNHNSQTSSFWEENANCLRISSVELGYRLPNDFIHRFKVEGVRLYVNLHNPITIANEREGRDFEAYTAGFTSYPLLKTWMMGLTVSL